MKVETIITTAGASFPGRYCASVVLDGSVTSWDCSHLHHSTAAAQKCLHSLCRKADEFLDGAEITRIGDTNSVAAEPLYEAAKDEIRPPSRLIQRETVVRVSRRFSLPYADAQPVWIAT